jgi:N-acetylglucosaminyldiphosphoundecaprenol N-acetyl-beta-D-mannosaminyltransferase
VDRLTMEETVERCAQLIETCEFHQHVVLNASKVVAMDSDPELRAIVGRCAVVNADGQSVVWASRLFGSGVPERVTGIDLMERLLERAAERQWPVFFLGARPEVLTAFESVVRSRFPGIVVAGRADGYFDSDTKMALSVAGTPARILFVAMPSPRKERFLSEQATNLGGLFAMGVGGSFDVWAGVARRAPGWMQRTGLEWAYRLLQEPGRLWHRYLVGNAKFIALVFAELANRRGCDS